MTQIEQPVGECLSSAQHTITRRTLMRGAGMVGVLGAMAGATAGCSALGELVEGNTESTVQTLLGCASAFVRSRPGLQERLGANCENITDVVKTIDMTADEVQQALDVMTEQLDRGEQDTDALVSATAFTQASFGELFGAVLGLLNDLEAFKGNLNDLLEVAAHTFNTLTDKLGNTDLVTLVATFLYYLNRDTIDPWLEEMMDEHWWLEWVLRYFSSALPEIRQARACLRGNAVG